MYSTPKLHKKRLADAIGFAQELWAANHPYRLVESEDLDECVTAVNEFMRLAELIMAVPVSQHRWEPQTHCPLTEGYEVQGIWQTTNVPCQIGVYMRRYYIEFGVIHFEVMDAAPSEFWHHVVELEHLGQVHTDEIEGTGKSLSYQLAYRHATLTQDDLDHMLPQIAIHVAIERDPAAMVRALAEIAWRMYRASYLLYRREYERSHARCG